LPKIDLGHLQNIDSGYDFDSSLYQHSLDLALAEREARFARFARPSVTSKTPSVTLALREKEADFTFGDL
jgi:hypothetical protein